MKVSLLPLDIAWGKAEENIRRASSLMMQRPTSDLYVLPEMWTTGFCVDPQEFAEDEDRSVGLDWMRNTAARLKCALSGSLAIKDKDGMYRNRHYFVTPDSVVFYDKHHLFKHGHEDTYFTPGNKPVIATWQGMRFLLQTCYDLRFPVFARYGRAGEYDAIIYVSNWPQSRQSAWNILTMARAIENQCYVVAVNRVGDDPKTTYAGGSAIIDPKGAILGTDHASLSLSNLQEMRRRFRVLEDRD